MMLLRDSARRQHALRGRRRACQCCVDFGSTKAGPRNRQTARQIQRRVERRTWQAEVEEILDSGCDTTVSGLS